MDLLEFLERTNHRNLKYQIGRMVAQSMRECDEDLDRRRMELAQQLQVEALELDEELAMMLQARADEADRQRLEWINMAIMKREEAEAELLKLKKQQREIENSEAYRHRQTKEILIESKLGQLQQIEERKARRLKEAHVDQLWVRVWQRLDASKAKQEQYEQKLRHLLETSVQAENQVRDEQQRQGQANQLLAEQRACAQALELAAEADERRQLQTIIKERSKRLQQFAELQEQMRSNQQLARTQAQLNYNEEMGSNIQEDAQIYIELQQKQYAMARNREWHQGYLAQTAVERRERRQEELRREAAYLESGCVLAQSLKQPYGRDVR